MLSERKSWIWFKIDNDARYASTMETIDENNKSRSIEDTITFFSLDNERHHRYAMGIVSFCLHQKFMRRDYCVRLDVLFRFDLW